MKKISVVLFIVICLFTVSSCSLFGLEPVAWKTDRYIIGLTFHNSNGEDSARFEYENSILDLDFSDYEVSYQIIMKP